MPKVLVRNEPSQTIDKHSFIKRSFTLIERVAVVAIVSLFATLLLPVWVGQKSQDKRRDF
jgi:prepilin-type N-terminal cleavage/methylation domain-containing protein